MQSEGLIISVMVTSARDGIVGRLELERMESAGALEQPGREGVGAFGRDSHSLRNSVLDREFSKFGLNGRVLL